MTQVAVGTLVNISKGKKPTSLTVTPTETAKRFLQINDLRDEPPLRFTEDEGVEANAEDVLITWDGANAGTVGWGLGGLIGSTLARLRPRDRGKLFGPYLGRFLASKFNALNGSTTGATIPHIDRAFLERLMIPLPPLTEQRRIVGILDTADSLRRKFAQSTELLDCLPASTFLHMFGEPTANSRGWELKALGDCFSAIETGTSLPGEDKPRRPGDWAVARVSAVTTGRFLPEKCKILPVPPAEADRLVPRTGDLLFSRANTRQLVAATCLVDRDDPRLTLPDKIWRIVPSATVADAVYLRFLIGNPAFRRLITKQATGTSGSMLNVSQDKVKSVRAPIPPLELQYQFATLYRKIELIRSQMVMAEGQHLFESVAHRVFRGQH